MEFFKLYREDITMKTIFEFDPWRLIETELHKDDMRLSESMTSIGNGHMGAMCYGGAGDGLIFPNAPAGRAAPRASPLRRAPPRP